MQEQEQMQVQMQMQDQEQEQESSHLEKKNDAAFEDDSTDRNKIQNMKKKHRCRTTFNYMVQSRICQACLFKDDKIRFRFSNIRVSRNGAIL
jgi:hypothetical protein